MSDRIRKSGIYKILNTTNDMFYIGQSVDFYVRWSKHKSELNKSIHDNSYLQNAWNKYGEDAFEFIVIEEVTDLSKLNEAEQFWMNITKCCNREIGYNLSPVAGSPLGTKHSNETKNKMSLIAKGHKRNLGKKHSEQTKIKIGNGNRGKIVTIETKIKMKASSTSRNINKWPHEKGNRCPCNECKNKRSEYNREYKK